MNSRTRYPWGTEAPKCRQDRLRCQIDRARTATQARRYKALLNSVEQYVDERHIGRRPRPVPDRRKCISQHGGVIYGLRDPATGEIRYVGYTGRPLSVRRAAHIYRARGTGKPFHVHRWIRGLLSAGVGPKIFALELIPAGHNWGNREVHWIAKLNSEGCRLTNGTAGGEGLSGYHHTPETRAVLSENVGAFMRTPEMRERCSKRMAKLSDAEVGAIAAMVRGSGVAVRQQELADKYGVAQSAISNIYRGKTFPHLVDPDTCDQYREQLKSKRRLLTDEQAVRAVKRYVAAEGRLSIADVAAEYGISRNTLGDIIRGLTYRDAIPPNLWAKACLVTKRQGKPSKSRALSDREAKAIRRRYSRGKASLAALAAEYAISKKAILNLVHGRTYRHRLA